LVRKPGGKRTLTTLKIDLGEIRFKNVDWINPAPDTDRWRTCANTVMYLLVPYKIHFNIILLNMRPAMAMAMRENQVRK
jgi:hypothetical protein